MSRSNARSRPLRHRPSRVVPASITAAVLAAVGVLTVIASMARLITGDWARVVITPASAVAKQTWSSAGVISAFATLAFLGLILIIAGVKLGGYRSAQLAVPDGNPVPASEYVISSRAIARLAAARADTVDGVDRVAVSATGKRVQLRVNSTSEETGPIRDRVHHEVIEELGNAGLQPVPRVSVTVRTRGI